MRLFLYLVAATALLSCAQKVIEVKVPVSVPCVQSIPVEPVMQSDALTIDNSIGEKVKALVIDNKALKSDNLNLRALISGCV